MSLIDAEFGAENEASCVVLCFTFLSPFTSIVNWKATPTGTTLAPFIFDYTFGRD